ncbi:MAG: ATP-binding cassette domain-containing protein [Candidatus Caldipriscus sp.]
MNLLDSLFLIAGISAKDLGFEKDLSTETSLKPPQVLKFLKDPIYMKKFGDSIVEVFRNFDREKLMGLIWWEKFYPIKVSDRVSYRDSTVGHIVDILVCRQYFLDRSLKGLNPKITEKITYVWDTVDRKDTLSKEDYLYLAKNVPWNLLANSFYCLLKLDTSKLKSIPDTGIYIYNTAYGKIALGGKGNNVYRGDFVAIVDFGGDDEYYIEKTALIVDFSGNDVYYGKVGSGYLGSSAIYDFSGDDTYYCSDYSCGGGLLGFGMIFDAEGDDFYSGGMRQRVLVAMALATEADVLFLDEPTIGLDPVSKQTVWEQIRASASEGRTVVVTTHNMEEAETISDRVAVINAGRIVAQGTPEEVRSVVGYAHRVDLRGDGIDPEELSGYGLVRRIGDRYRVYLSDSAAKELLDLAIARGWAASLSRTTLEDAFVLLVGEVEERAG